MTNLEMKVGLDRSGQVKLDDVVIAISNSGEPPKLKATIETLKSNGSKIIGVSGNEESWLKAASEVFFCWS